VDNQDSTPLAKHCSKCQQAKPLFEFGSDRSRNGGLKAYCKSCHNATNKAARQKNIDKYKAIEKAWRDANKDKMRIRTSSWCKQNPDRMRELVYAWRDNNPDKVRETSKRQNQKRLATPEGRLRSRVGHAIRLTLRGKTKAAGAFRHLGYTAEHLADHIQRQFLPGMGWHNISDWHIDHIVPISSFHYNTPYDIEFQQAWALSNLRPLWAVDNLRKSNKKHFLL
jgi:RNA:NAD 2'-phosphotransferase (TPT1/KptA family)